jgi:hypothetical protein
VSFICQLAVIKRHYNSIRLVKWEKIMGYIIDIVFAVREIFLLVFLVATSPMGIIAGLLLLNDSSRGI